jgi:hypothetical protein
MMFAGPGKPNPRTDPERPQTPPTDPDRRDRPADPEPDGPMPDMV